jgi:hypothetical protein
MNEERITESPWWNDPRGQAMKTPNDLVEMLRMRACGWGLKRIARDLHNRLQQALVSLVVP